METKVLKLGPPVNLRITYESTAQHRAELFLPLGTGERRALLEVSDGSM